MTTVHGSRSGATDALWWTHSANQYGRRDTSVVQAIIIFISRKVVRGDDGATLPKLMLANGHIDFDTRHHMTGNRRVTIDLESVTVRVLDAPYLCARMAVGSFCGFGPIVGACHPGVLVPARPHARAARIPSPPISPTHPARM